MKPAWLFVVSAALSMAGVWLLFQQFQGNARFNGGWPPSSFSFEIAGAARGGGVAAAILLVVIAAAVFLWALIITISGQMPPASSVPSERP